MVTHEGIRKSLLARGASETTVEGFTPDELDEIIKALPTEVEDADLPGIMQVAAEQDVDLAEAAQDHLRKAMGKKDAPDDEDDGDEEEGPGGDGDGDDEDDEEDDDEDDDEDEGPSADKVRAAAKKLMGDDDDEDEEDDEDEKPSRVGKALADLEDMLDVGDDDALEIDSEDLLKSISAVADEAAANATAGLEKVVKSLTSEVAALKAKIAEIEDRPAGRAVQPYTVRKGMMDGGDGAPEIDAGMIFEAQAKGFVDAGEAVKLLKGLGTEEYAARLASIAQALADDDGSETDE